MKCVDQQYQSFGAGPHLAQRKPEQHRDHQHRQDFALGDSADHVVWDHFEQEVDDRQRFGAGDVTRDGLLVERGGVDMQPRPGLQQIADAEPDQQRQGGNELEVDDRTQADDADAAHIADLGNADGDRRKNQNRDDGADQRDERIAERLHLDCEAGVEIAQQQAEPDRDQHLNIEPACR